MYAIVSVSKHFTTLLLGQIMKEDGNFIVYQMGRLCGGAHEISGIKAPLFLHGWVGVVGWSMAVNSDRWWVGVVLSGLTWGGD